MTVNEYQKESIKTRDYGKGEPIIYPALKLNGEAGEVAEKVGKALRDNDGVFTDEIKLGIAREIGDVLWYCAALSDEIGYTLDEICQLNIEKVQKRREENKIHGEGDNR